MKKVGAILLLILVISFLVIGYFKLFSKESGTGTPFKTYVRSYEDCNQEISEMMKDQPKCVASYNNINQPEFFKECMDNGGKVKCPSKPPLVEDCSSKYRWCDISFSATEKEYDFPKTFDECRSKALTHGSYLGIQFCEVDVEKNNFSLWNKCLELGGYESEDYCTLVFISPKPERKDRVAQDCASQTTDLGTSIKAVCAWALNQNN